MIRVSDLRFAHPGGGFTLSVPRLDVEAGARAAVVGPSGTGKTTLLNLVAGILVPGAGEVEVAGTPVSALGDAARRRFRIGSIGFVFQNFALIDYLNVRENILYPYRINPSLTLNGTVRKRAEMLADEVGLGAKLSRKPNALSQGEMQRVAICRAMVTRPKVILADEATGNLDPENKELILDLIFAQAAEAGATVLAVTHDHALLGRFDRVIDFADFREAGQ